MPLIDRSTYSRRPWFLFNGHLETIIPSMFFHVDEVAYERQRLELEDGDFLDLDWLKNSHRNLMIITHGLEGSADRYYVKRTAKYFSDAWDILAWNCRGCSGEMNRLPRFYHHGDTQDLHYVVTAALSTGRYDKLVFVGYSMGGSMSLKYLGERKPDKRIAGAVTFSVPCDLKDSNEQLRLMENRIYENRFLKKLKEKIVKKHHNHPSDISIEGLDALSDFDQFHERYTAPLHGFSNAEDFFEKSTCDQFLEHIRVPVLIANALNDPLLGEKCYPKDLASSLPNVYLETPNIGGHVGFTQLDSDHSWMENRISTFIEEFIDLPSPQIGVKPN